VLNQEIQSTIRAYLLTDSEDGRTGYLYFNYYFCSKELKQETAEAFLSETLNSPELSSRGPIEGGGFLIRIDGAPILFWEIDEERWLLTYSSEDLDKRHRDKLSKAHKKIGWILPAQFESKVVDEIYHDFSPEEESVNIERKWSPYWIYERGSEIPENLQGYYQDHIDEFVEKEIEFNVKTPGWLVDTAFKQGVQEELLNKSEISMSRFTYEPDQSVSAVSDGGIASEDFQSSVTVRQEGRVVHRSGVPEATFSLLDQIELRDDLFDELSEIIPEREYTKLENGIVDTEYFRPGGTLDIVFSEKDFNEEASITLSNLLSVGQDDVKLHGTVQWRDGLEFQVETYTPFDEGEYQIYFTSEEDESGEEKASLSIRPRSATAAGFVYLFRKLKEKFDPRVEYAIEKPPSAEEA